MKEKMLEMIMNEIDKGNWLVFTVNNYESGWLYDTAYIANSTTEEMEEKIKRDLDICFNKVRDFVIESHCDYRGTSNTLIAHVN